MKKNGFTLVEVTAVVAILAILAVLVVPKVSNTINNNKAKACNSIKTSAEDAASSYTYMHTGSIDNTISTVGYADVTLLILMQEGLLDTKLENPYTHEEISKSNVVRISKNDNVYEFKYMGDECE